MKIVIDLENQQTRTNERRNKGRKQGRVGRGEDETAGPTSVQTVYSLKCKKQNSRIHQRTKNTIKMLP